MAGEGFGTTSIGTGGAQVVGSPTYNLERYAQPILQKQKDIAAEKAAKQKRQEKIFGDLKGLSKIGSLRYAPATEKVKNTVIEAAKKAIATQDVGDLMALEKAKLDYNTVLDLAKQNDAFANNIGSQMIQGGNFWNKEKFDNYYTPVDVNNINTAEDLIKQMTLDRNDLGEVRRDKHNPIEFANKMGGIAKTFYGNEGKFTDDDLKSSIDALFKNDEQSFDTFKHYLADAEKNADLLKKFNGDATAAAKELAYNDFKNLVGVKPARSGLTINNIMPSEKVNPVFAAYSVQDIPLGMKAANTDYPTPFQTAVIQLPSQGVELGGGLVSTDMYRVTTSGETEQLKGQSAPTLKYTQVTSLPIATKDTEVVDTSGRKFTIKKGQVVQPDYKAAAKTVNKIDIPTENKLMAIAVGEDGSTYYRPAQDVAKAIVTTFSGQKGLNYKGETVLKDIDDFGNFLNSIGIDVQGYTLKQNTTKQYKSRTFEME